jgi:hypothetical protein
MLPSLRWQVGFCWDTYWRETCRNIADNKGVGCDYRTIANVDLADDARITSDMNVIAIIARARI